MFGTPKVLKLSFVLTFRNMHYSSEKIKHSQFMQSIYPGPGFRHFNVSIKRTQMTSETSVYVLL